MLRTEPKIACLSARRGPSDMAELIRLALSVVWISGICWTMDRGLGYGLVYLAASVVVALMIDARERKKGN